MYRSVVVAVSLHVVGMLIDNSLVTTAVHMRPQALVVDPLEVAVTVVCIMCILSFYKYLMLFTD